MGFFPRDRSGESVLWVRLIAGGPEQKIGFVAWGLRIGRHANDRAPVPLAVRFLSAFPLAVDIGLAIH